MFHVKKFAAGLLAVVMLLSAMPVPALATEAEAGTELDALTETEVITEPENTEGPEPEEGECQHQYVADITEPTCTKGGFTTYTCSLCQDTYTADAVDPTGACRLEPVAEVSATCTQTGVTAHFRCSLCEAVYWDAEGEKPVEDKAELVLAVLDHEFGEWEVVEFPGPDITGMEARHCLNCEAQETREIPALSCDLAAPKLTVKLDSETGKPLLSWTEVPGAEALAREFSRLSGYGLEEVPFASSFAGYKDWFIQEYRRPGFTVEVGQGENPLPLSQFSKIYADNLGILTTAALGLPGSSM